MIKFTCIIGLMAMAMACSQKTALGPDEYKRYATSEESGLILNEEINAITYRVKLLPPALLAIRHTDVSVSSNLELQKAVLSYTDQLNFTFLIEDPDKNSHRVKSTVFDKARYASVLSYANTELRNDFMLLGERDTVYCSLVHLEPANSVQPMLRLSIGFHHANLLHQEFTLVYNDHIFNNGPVKFRYPKQVMENLPELKL